MNETKPMPSDVKSELIVLATIFEDSENCEYAFSVLTPGHFYNTDNRIIFSAAAKLYELGILQQEPDNIESYLESEKLITENQKVALYNILHNVASTATGIKNYIELLTEKKIRRSVIVNSSRAITQAEDLDSPITDIVLNAERFGEEITGISESSQRGKIIEVESIRGKMDDFYEHGRELRRGVSTDWEKLSDLYRPAKGTLNIITGIPSHGKSSLIDALAVNISMLHNWKWAIFSPEYYPFELHLHQLIEKYTGLPLFNRTECERMKPETMSNAITWINEHFYFIEPPEDKITFETVYYLFSQAKKKYNIDGCIIDPFNELEPKLKDVETETEYIGRCLSKSRRFARKNDIAFFILAHPAKMYKKPGTDIYDVPTLYSINGSAHWYNKADNGITIFRDFNKDIVRVHVQKIKFRLNGTMGTVTMRYNKINGRFFEYDENEKKDNNF